MFADALQKRRVIVVGYYNVDVKAGKYAMIALNMDPMNPEKTASLDEVFPYNANMTASTASGGADQIQIWDFEKQTYRYFFMYNNAFQPTNEKNKHWVENVTGQPLADVQLKTGDAVFFFAKSKDNTLSIPGQVPAEASGILKHGYNMVGVGFPTAWNPNDAGTDFWKDAKFAKSTASGGADQIQYWDDANQKYRFFFLYNNAFQPSNEKNNKWVENITGNPVLVDALKTGEGFFYYRKNAGEIEFKPGLKLN